MADTPENVTESEEGRENSVSEDAKSTPEQKKIPSKVLLLCIIIIVILLFSVGGWFVYKHFTSHPEAEKGISQIDEGKETTPTSNCYLPIPEIVANLRSTKSKGNVLRAAFLLQLYKKEDETKIKEFMPIIVDQTLSYLRDQTVADLEGPGLERMRQAIFLRVSNIIRPAKIYRVILKDFIIQ